MLSKRFEADRALSIWLRAGALMAHTSEEFSRLTQPHRVPAAQDIDLPTLGQALWRAKTTVLALAIGAGVLTFVVLSMMRPLYTSEARILIQNDESAFTRPATEQ